MNVIHRPQDGVPQRSGVDSKGALLHMKADAAGKSSAAGGLEGGASRNSTR